MGEPEAHDVLDRFAGRDGGRIHKALLPGLGDIVEAVIESRLAFEEIQDIAGASFALASDIGHAVRSLEAEIRPDEAVGVLIFLSLLAFFEPRMFLRRVSRYQIQQDSDSFPVRFFKETEEVFICAVSRRHFLVVAHVVPRVFKWRVKARIDPERVAAEAFDVVQLLGNSVDISDPVPIRIAERLRINFIENRIL